METITLTLQQLADELTASEPLHVVLALAPAQRRLDALDQLAPLVRVSQRWKAAGHERLQLENGSDVRIGSINRVRGFSLDLIVIEEGRELTPDLVDLLAPSLVVRGGRIAYLTEA